MSEGVIEFKKRRRASSRELAPLVAINEHSGPARYLNRMRRDIERDLGGRKFLNRIELEYIEAFIGAATRLKYHNHQLLLGECEADLTAYFQLVNALVRLGTKLERRRAGKDIAARSQPAPPTLQSFSALAADDFEHTAAGAADSADTGAIVSVGDGSSTDEVA